MEYMEDNGIEMPERPEGMERGDREEGGSLEEGQNERMRGENNQGGGLEEVFTEAGVEMPDDWDEMTQEERKEFM